MYPELEPDEVHPDANPNKFRLEEYKLKLRDRDRRREYWFPFYVGAGILLALLVIGTGVIFWIGSMRIEPRCDWKEEVLMRVPVVQQTSDGPNVVTRERCIPFNLVDSLADPYEEGF